MNSFKELTAAQLAIAAKEVRKYKHVWENCKTYDLKHHDVELWERLGASMSLSPGASIIVLGCGSGKLVYHLAKLGYEVVGVDIFEHSLWPSDKDGPPNSYPYSFLAQPLWEELPSPKSGKKWDLAICADVMEHIPPELLPHVFKKIDAACLRVLFQVANMNSSFEGLNLHMIKKDSDWWLERILDYCSGVGMVVPHDDTPDYRFVIDYHGI